MKLATWNVNSLGARLDYVLEWLDRAAPDIVCLQETKKSDEAFPASVFTDAGYESVHHGDGQWNGVAILSRLGVGDPEHGWTDDGCRLLAADCGGIRVHSVYVPNGRSLDSEHYTIKLAWFERLVGFLAERHKPGDDLVVCGDFNVAPFDADVWDPAQFVGMTHTSAPEREALVRLLEWGFVDVFHELHPEGGLFSWWDYRGGAFHKGHGMRIDLVLATASLASRCSTAEVDREACKKSPKENKPSDHAPVVVDLT